MTPDRRPTLQEIHVSCRPGIVHCSSRSLHPFYEIVLRARSDRALCISNWAEPTWVTQYTQTFNEHWIEEGRPSPYEPFPDLPYLKPVFEIMDLKRIVWIEKSRDMMISWACVAYLTLHAMRVAERGVIFQTQKYEKAIDLVNYAKCLYRRQAPWLKDIFPLAKPLDSQPQDRLEFASGGYVLGIPGGADQIRGHHP